MTDISESDEVSSGRSGLETFVFALFLLLIFSLGFMQPNIRFSGMRLQATDILFPLLFVGCIAVAVKERFAVRPDRTFVLIAVYFLTLASAAVFSVRPAASFPRLAGELFLVLLALGTAFIVRSEKDIRFAVFAWIAASSLVCLVAVVTAALFYIDRDNLLLNYTLHHYGSLPPGNYPRVHSTFVYPAMLANYLTVSIVFLLFGKVKEWFRRSFWPLFVLHLAAAGFTVTPGLGGLILGIGLFVWVFRDPANSPRLAFVALAIGILAAIGSVVVSAVTTRPISSSPFWFEPFGYRIDPTQRLLTWIGAWQTMLEYPLTGRGLGLDVARVYFEAPSGQKQMLTDAHNTWLNIGGQAGIPGFLASITLTIALIGRSLPLRISEAASSSRAMLGVAFIAAFVAQGFVGSFENARHLWVLIGLLLASARMREASEKV
ncbi:MAG: O-antigen ligase family protein [Acidobacteria bacterium]|nr:O-antigen ligase family protein [Acidobacteriota bacterium]